MALVIDASTKTWGTAKAEVVRVGGQMGDTDWLAVAQDAITTAIRLWQIRRDWYWLAISTSVTLLPSTSDYALPAGFRKEYDAFMLDRKLSFVPQRYYDTVNPGNTGTGPYFYSMFNSANTGNITLLPPVGATIDANNNKVYIRYWRKITGFAADGTVLDVPDAYEPGILAHAKAIFLADKGGDDARMERWQSVGDSFLMAAIADDEKHPDYMAQLLPEPIGGPYGWNPNSLATLLSGTAEDF